MQVVDYGVEDRVDSNSMLRSSNNEVGDTCNHVYRSDAEDVTMDDSNNADDNIPITIKYWARA